MRTAHELIIQLPVLHDSQQLILDALKHALQLCYILPMLCKCDLSRFRDGVTLLNRCSPVCCIQKFAQVVPHIWP